MQIPGAPSVLFLVYLLMILPWLAIKKSRQLRELASTKTGQSRASIWCSTLVAQAVLLVVAWLAGSSFDFAFLAIPNSLGLGIAAAAIATIALFLIRAILRYSRTTEEKQRLLVFLLVPRSSQEWRLKILAIIAASVAEEVAYRGVGMAILVYSTGSVILAIIISSVAFAAAHWSQGTKSLIAIFLIAATMHGLVLITGTLLFAIIVHAIYDLIAMTLIWREAQRMGLVSEHASNSS